MKVALASAQELISAQDAEIKTFEFVTLTSQPTTEVLRQTSTTVRKQAMHDYIRKLNRQKTTGIAETAQSVKLEEPARYKNKFKLDTWTHKTKEKAIVARKANVGEEKNENVTSHPHSSASKSASHIHQLSSMICDRPLQRLLVPSAGAIDPFNTLCLEFAPHSTELLHYYFKDYTMNSIAINAECDFFCMIKTDSALFNSILYLVALHRDISHNTIDSSACLYHGSEAFRIINERLSRDVVSDDVTIAAVAMLANKENLNGRYKQSMMHMKGLMQMVRTRGGVHSLPALFKRIITWSDLCFSNAWNVRPTFPRVQFTPPSSPPHVRSLQLDGTILDPSNIFEKSSPIVDIIHDLRRLSSLVPPTSISRIPRQTRVLASNLIYDIEFSLLTLHHADPVFETSNCLPLRTALLVYLYISIRLIPRTSALVQTMFSRLVDSLETTMDWWTAGHERRMWLLWILFVGVVAFADEDNAVEVRRLCLARQLRDLCEEMDIYDVRSLNLILRGTIWEAEWCESNATIVWGYVVAVGYSDKRHRRQTSSVSL